MEKVWTIQIRITEVDDDRTQAHAVLSADGVDRLHGEGFARRNPSDQPMPMIGDELAVARALGDLTHRLFEVAAADIEAFTKP